MLLYDYKKSHFTLLLETKKEKTNQHSIFKGILRFVLQTITNIAIAVASSFLGPAGLAVDFILSTATDTLFNAIFNDSFNWGEFAIDAAINAIPLISKGIRVISNIRRANKVLSIADNIKMSNVAYKAKLTKSASELSNFKVNKLSNIPNFKTFEKENQTLIKVLNEVDTFKKTAEQSFSAYNKFNTAFKKVSNSFVKLRSFVSLLTSPRYAGKKLTDLVLRKPKAFLNKTINKWIDQKTKKIFGKFSNKTIEKAKKHIPLNSQWLSHLKLIRTYNPWDLKSTNAMVYFQPQATNKKQPVLLVNKPLKDVLGLTTASSPGKYYLDNFAWGWTIGKILRNKKGFITKSIIPIFGSFLGTLLFTGKTIEYIAKSFSKKKWLYSEPNAAQEFFKGIKDNTFKNINIRYTKPIISTARAIMSQNARYAIYAGLRVGNQAAYNHAIKKYMKPKKKKKGGGVWIT